MRLTGLNLRCKKAMSLLGAQGENLFPRFSSFYRPSALLGSPFHLQSQQWLSHTTPVWHSNPLLSCVRTLLITAGPPGKYWTIPPSRGPSLNHICKVSLPCRWQLWVLRIRTQTPLGNMIQPSTDHKPLVRETCRSLSLLLFYTSSLWPLQNIPLFKLSCDSLTDTSLPSIGQSCCIAFSSTPFHKKTRKQMGWG